MTYPAALFAIRWMIRDTFRQSLASGIFWLMLGLSILCMGVCLSIGVSDLPEKPTERVEQIPAPLYQRTVALVEVTGAVGLSGTGSGQAPLLVASAAAPGKTAQGIRRTFEEAGLSIEESREMTFGFGAFPVKTTRYREEEVRHVQLILMGFLADTGGILLMLIWTAGFMPTFLESSSISVLLAKPVPRWSLLAGKYLGVLVFVAFQVIVFVGGIWLALALKIGVWDGACFLAIPLLLIHFAIFFSFSVLLAVATRSTVACVFGSLLFWLICLAMNLGRHSVVLLPEMEAASGAFKTLVEVGYWVLPKPGDLGIFLMQALQAENEFSQAFNVAGLEKKAAWHPEASFLASCGFAVVMLMVAAREFVTVDY